MSITIPDIEIFEWYSRNNIKIVGLLFIFKYCLVNGLLKHAIWILSYINKTNYEKPQLQSLIQNNEEIADIYHLIIRRHFKFMFDWLIINGFPYNKEIFDFIGSNVAEDLSFDVLEFFENYNKKKIYKSV